MTPGESIQVVSTDSSGNFSSALGTYEQNSGASGNPPTLPSFGANATGSSTIQPRLSDQSSGSDGTGLSRIYAGSSITTNTNPLSFDSGRPITGGYSVVGELGSAQGDANTGEAVVPTGDFEGVSSQQEIQLPDDEVSRSVAPAVNTPHFEINELSGSASQTDEAESSESEATERAAAGLIEGTDTENVSESTRVSFLRRFGNWLQS